jgi:hypothetical protein
VDAADHHRYDTRRVRRREARGVLATCRRTTPSLWSGGATRMSAMLWERVGELADRAPLVSDLRYHKLQLIAASRMRERGEQVPEELMVEERALAAMSLAVPLVLRRIREACDGPLVVMKGAEVAARWVHPRLRPAVDIDLLVEDADAVQSSLLAAGFVFLDDPTIYGSLHHQCPMGFPGLPIAVEVHRRPHWCGGPPPDVAEIVAAAQPCALGVEGILAPRPDHHVILLAAHAWAHGPLERISHLADIAAMLQDTTAEAAQAVAESWGIPNVWRTTTRAIDEVLLNSIDRGRPPVWKRHLSGARERTVFEEHVTRIVAPAAAASAGRAPMSMLVALAKALRPYPEEGWSGKVVRTIHAFRHAAWARSQHEAAVDAPAQAPE